MEDELRREQSCHTFNLSFSKKVGFRNCFVFSEKNKRLKFFDHDCYSDVQPQPRNLHLSCPGQVVRVQRVK